MLQDADNKEKQSFEKPGPPVIHCRLALIFLKGVNKILSNSIEFIGFKNSIQSVIGKSMLKLISQS